MPISDALKGDTGKGLAIGVAIVALAPLAAPIVAALAKPIARAAIRTGAIAYEKGREALAEVAEVVEDLVAEARTELAEQGSKRSEHGAAEGATGGEANQPPAS